VINGNIGFKAKFNCRTGELVFLNFIKSRRVMTGHKIVIQLNQQQLELVDKTVERGEAKNRVDLIHRALREYAAAHGKNVKGAVK
jgi:hypothetical protein